MISTIAPTPRSPRQSPDKRQSARALAIAMKAVPEVDPHACDLRRCAAPEGELFAPWAARQLNGLFVCQACAINLPRGRSRLRAMPPRRKKSRNVALSMVARTAEARSSPTMSAR